MLGKDLLGWAPEDYAALTAMAQRQGAPAEWFASVMMSESSMNPSAVNASGCVGLIQFCSPPVSGIRAMSPAEQMPWIENFYAPKRPAGGWPSRAAIYLANYLPAVLRSKGSDPSTVIATAGDGLYQGAIFDHAGKGFSTVADLEQRLQDVTSGAKGHAAAMWNAALAGIAAAGGASPPSSFHAPSLDSLELGLRVLLIGGLGVASFLAVEDFLHRSARPRYVRVRRRMAT
jgi:hypothetical protein